MLRIMETVRYHEWLDGAFGADMSTDNRESEKLMLMEFLRSGPHAYELSHFLSSYKPSLLKIFFVNSSRILHNIFDHLYLL